MKLTAKVARHGYDLRYFFETIDFAGHGKVKFVQFMAIMKDRFYLYLSPEEIESLFLYFSPEHAEALVNNFGG
jgi:Ca2+-binding EF-hand superfamily protein